MIPTTAAETPRPMASRLRRGMLAALVAAVVAVSAACLPPAETPAAGTADVVSLPVDDQRAVDLVNRLRAEHGLPALRVHDHLSAKARSWVGTMAAEGQLRHSNLLEGIPAATWQFVGENVGRTGATVDPSRVLHDAYVASPSHRANILEGRFTHIGVAHVRAADGTFYQVQTFGQHR